MRYILFLFTGLFLFNTLSANESKVCQKCHPLIYKEYYESSHRRASVYNNELHKAMWDKHPKTPKGYTCAKCHSPSDEKALKYGELAENSIQKDEPISCVYCHTIKDIQEGDDSNTNISNGKKREFYTSEKGHSGKAEYKTVTSWFGLIKESKASPFHKIDYDNKNYTNGNMCMGCHSHTNNEHSFDISMLDAMIDDKDKNTCVTCHMPQVAGTKVTLLNTKTHAYHGIAGIYHKTKDLGKYVDFEVSKSDHGFKIRVINRSNHALFGQAFRQGILKVQIIRNSKTINLPNFVFERILGKDSKEVAMPWDADSAIKDTLIYAKRDVDYSLVIKDGDTLVVSLGVQLISKDGLKKLGLQKKDEFTRFRTIKTQKFHF